MGCGGIIVSYGMLGILILGCIVCSIWEFIMLFSNGLQVLPLLGSLISLIGISVWMTKDRIQKDNFDIYNESFKLILIFGAIQFCFWLPIEFDDKDRMMLIFSVASFGQVAKCCIGNIVSRSFEESRNEKIKGWREYLCGYYHRQADTLQNMVKLFGSSKRTSGAVENLMNLLIICGCTKLGSAFQNSDINRNENLVGTLKTELSKIGLAEAISDDMTIATMKENMQKLIPQIQERAKHYQEKYFSTSDYKVVKKEYEHVLELEKNVQTQEQKQLRSKSKRWGIFIGVMAVTSIAASVAWTVYNDCKNENIYQEALEQQHLENYIAANDLFEEIRGYKDVDMLIDNQKFEVEHQRILQANIGDIVIFGECPDETLEVSGPIEWIVLNKQNGKIMLISKDILIHKPYNKNTGEITWECSTLRNWLNSIFYMEAFEKKERVWISRSSIANNDNLVYDTPAGENTVDRIFLLSNDEATEMLPLKEASDWWWLRSPGMDAQNVARVSINGTFVLYRGALAVRSGGVRPVMWVS